MNDPSSPKTTRINSFKTGAVQSTEVLYFTGGLVAIPIQDGGLALGPITAADKFCFLPPMTFEDACLTASHAGCYYVGVNQAHVGGGPERSEFWSPNLGESGIGQSSDSWAGIANKAHSQQDEDYADVARYLSISLRSAGWRLREASRLHHEQLQWALIAGRPSGSRFSNLPIFDLYLAIHSLVAEMCAARDYLAQIAVAKVCAKPGTDSLARLCNWLEKPVNQSAQTDPLIKLLLAAVGTPSSPGWLMELSDLRNKLMHRQPMAASPETAALLFQQVETKAGLVPTIRLSRFRMSESIIDREDPFVALLHYWLALERLSRSCVPLARYPVEHPHFSA